MKGITMLNNEFLGEIFPLVKHLKAFLLFALEVVSDSLLKDKLFAGNVYFFLLLLDLLVF